MALVRVSATGTVKATAARVKKVFLTPAAAVSTLVLRDGGAGGTVKLEVQAAANGQTAECTIEDGEGFGTDVHATLAGAGAVAYVGF